MLIKHVKHGDKIEIIDTRDGENWLVSMEYVRPYGGTPYLRFFHKRKIFIKKQGDSYDNDRHTILPVRHNSVQPDSHPCTRPQPPNLSNEIIGNKCKTRITYKRPQTRGSQSTRGDSKPGE